VNDGHISIGLELVNSLWRKLQTDENTQPGVSLIPSSKTCECICSILIGAHHGEPQFGLAVSRRHPKRWRFPYIDNLMPGWKCRAGYLVAKPIADRIFIESALPGNLVKPLEKFQAPSSNGPPPLPKTGVKPARFCSRFACEALELRGAAK